MTFRLTLFSVIFVTFNPGEKVEIIRNTPVYRYDIDLRNCKGHVLKCTFYAPQQFDKAHIGCVIYLHGNASSRIEALQTRHHLLPKTTLFCFDCAGAGKSEGEYVTLGLNEAQDLAIIVKYVKNVIGISKIALWGRRYFH